MARVPFVIMPIYDILLHGSLDMPLGLFQLHHAAAEQLCRLHYKPGCIKSVKARLKTLADHGYVQHDVIPSKAFRKPYYYTLTGKGSRYLHKAGLDVSDAFRAVKEVDKHGLFVDHALELNDIIVSAALLKGTGNGFHLYTFVHERTLRRKPYKATWRVNGRLESHSVIPDAFLDFRYVVGEKRLRLPVLIEHDRGTEQRQHFQRRIRAYIAFLQAQAQKEVFAARAVTIAFTTFAGDVRLAQMRQWAKQELASYETALGQAFVFANLMRPPEPKAIWCSPCWYTASRNQPITLLEVA